MQFVPTIEQVQEAARRLPPAQEASTRTAHYRVVLQQPTRYADRPEDYLHGHMDGHILQFDMHRFVDKYGREWFRWQLNGGVLV